MTNDKDKAIDFELLEEQAQIQAIENVEKYGYSDRKLQLLILQEQLGKLSRERTHTIGDLGGEYNKLIHVMAMCYCYYIQLERKRFGGKFYKEDLDPRE